MVRPLSHLPCVSISLAAGGFGLNTGLQDAHNLAWRLGAATRFGEQPSGSPPPTEAAEGSRLIAGDGRVEREGGAESGAGGWSRRVEPMERALLDG